MLQSVIVVFIAILLFLYINYRWDNIDTSSFTTQDIAQAIRDKTIVITGANAGLGYSTVDLLAQAGTIDSTIIMACRNINRCNYTRQTILQTTQTKVQLYTVELDLSSIKSIKSFAATVQHTLEHRSTDFHLRQATTTNTSNKSSHTPPIHVLINNAGIMGTAYSLANETSVEMQMQVNHIGHFALTSLLLPNLIAATKVNRTSPSCSTNDSNSTSNGRARIVSVSSLMGSYGPAFQLNDINFIHRRLLFLTNRNRRGTDHSLSSTSKYYYYYYRNFMIDMIQSFSQYAASKRANLLFTHGLHQHLYVPSKGTIQSMVVHPGYSRTSLVLSGWTFIPLWFRTLFSLNRIGSMSATNGAMCIVRAALDPRVHSDEYVGPLYMTFGRPTVIGTSLNSKHHLLWPIYNVSEVDTLWRWSESVIGWKFPSI